MAKVYFSLGSNAGDRLDSLVKATKLIGNRIGRVIQYSPVFESEPWGFMSETTFFNMVVVADTEFSPQQVLSQILDIETSLGRTRHGKGYANRIIDIDILFYNSVILNEDKLVIPHPLLHLRKFVLQPLAEIAPEFIHPVLHVSARELLRQLNESGSLSVAVESERFAILLNPINQS